MREPYIPDPSFWIEDEETQMSFTNMQFEFDRQAIIDAVTENRDRHIDEYEGALEGYYLELVEKAEEAKKTIERVIKKAQKDKDPEQTDLVINMRATKPQSHEADYDRAIAMFEMASTDTIPLDEQSFAQYVRDEWDWKNEFLATSTYYNSKLASH